MKEQDQAVEHKPGLRAFASTFIASVGGFLFGYDLSVIGAANIYLREQFALSDAAMGLATSSAVMGCIFGPFLGAWCCDALGRKKTMIGASLLLAASAVVTALARDMITFNIFRFVGGIGVGLCSLASPMYIAETTPPKHRGKMGTMYQLAIVIGSIIAPLVAFFLVRGLADTVSWRWMFASENIAILIFVIFLFGLPNSPRWLAEKGRYDDALKVLERISGRENAQAELDQIKQEIEESESGKAGSFSELFAPGMRIAMKIGVILAFFAQWTGWSAMGGYIPYLFEKAGMENRAMAILQFAVSYGVMGAMTFVSLIVVDRVGRKPLWIGASFLMAIIMGMTGLVFHLEIGGILVLLVIILCTVPHGIGLGGLPWLMMSEIFPTRLRAKGVALSTTCLWIFCSGAVWLTPMIIGYSEKKIGTPAGTFWLFSFICVVSAIFGIKMLPETKGRTLEEIAKTWKR